MKYWDYCAGAPLSPATARTLAEEAMSPAGNPSSLHQAGRAARARLDAARAQIARVLRATTPREIVFTSSGTEANALALLGAWEARTDTKRTRLVATAIEHPSTLKACELLASRGADVVLVRPDATGLVSAQAFLTAVTDDTFLCAMMAVNNETGVRQPIVPVAARCADMRIPFHCDAVQALGRIPLEELPADLLAISGHKVGAPPGIGVLRVRDSVTLRSILPGHQERGLRGGTESLHLVRALAVALGELPVRDAESKLTELRDLFERELLARLPSTTVNGGGPPRIGGVSNLSFAGVLGEELLVALDLRGVCASSGAACASGSTEPSHVLLAMGRSPTTAAEAVRFSFGPGTVQEDVLDVVEIVAEEVTAIRQRE